MPILFVMQGKCLFQGISRPALKNTGKSLKGLSTVDRDQIKYKIVVPLFGAAYAAPNIGPTIIY